MSSPEMDPADMDPKRLASMDENAFGAKIKEILEYTTRLTFGDPDRRPQGDHPAISVIQSRAAEPPTVAALSDAILSRINSEEEVQYVSLAIQGVVVHLPYETLALYRSAFETGLRSTMPPHPDPSFKHSMFRELLRFIDSPTDVWAPEEMNNDMGERSLRERVHTAEEMRPHVLGLLQWLAEPYWPPFRGCRTQLTRFPEVTVGPIRELIGKIRGDGGHIYWLLDFVMESVPVGELWRELDRTVRALIEEPRGDEDEFEAPDLAKSWLQKFEKWKARQDDMKE